MYLFMLYLSILVYKENPTRALTIAVKSSFFLFALYYCPSLLFVGYAAI